MTYLWHVNRVYNLVKGDGMWFKRENHAFFLSIIGILASINSS